MYKYTTYITYINIHKISIYLSTYLSICLSIYLSFYLSIYLYDLFLNLFIYTCIHTYIYICVSVLYSHVPWPWHRAKVSGLGAALDACGSASAWRQALEVLRAARRRQKWWGKRLGKWWINLINWVSSWNFHEKTWWRNGGLIVNWVWETRGRIRMTNQDTRLKIVWRWVVIGINCFRFIKWWIQWWIWLNMVRCWVP